MLTFSTNLVAKNATTQFVNYDFNSMVNFNGKQLGAGASGIFDIGGDSDDGYNIDAYFEPSTSDFGVVNPKRLRYVYLGFEADGDLEVTTSDDSGDHETKAVKVAFTGQQRGRIPVTRALSGRYWRIRVGNRCGADFAVDAIVVRASRISRGISQRT